MMNDRLKTNILTNITTEAGMYNCVNITSGKSSGFPKETCTRLYSA